MNIKNIFGATDDFTRRDFVTGASRALLGVSAMPLFSAFASAQEKPQEKPLKLTPATARNVIYLYMSGGMSHLDTFDPKPGAETQGPTESIKTKADDVLIASHFKNLARHMDKVAIVSSMTTTQGAHAQGRYFMHTSYEMRGTIKHPSLGAWLMRMRDKDNPALPGHVAIGNSAGMASAGFMESRYLPLPIGSPEDGLQDCERAKGVSEAVFDRRLKRLEEVNRAFAQKYDQKSVRAYGDMYKEAVRLMTAKDLVAFDISDEPDDLKAAYGNNQFGQGCLLARRLIEHNVRFVEVVNGGWDTHNQNFDSMEEKCPPLDQTIATLLADLEVRGLLDETLVVLATEFGRTPTIVRDNLGRNHYPKAFSCLLAGGGIRGGRRYGRTSETGEEVIQDRVTVPDFNATIAHALGLPLDHIIYSPSGRPFTVAHKGQPIKALFA